MKKASIINFKGGVGKTTLSLHLACHLAQDHRVLLVDVDHQSSLSVVVLQGLWEGYVAKNQTVNRIFESFCNRKVQMPGNEIIVKNPMHQRDKRFNIHPNLDFVRRSLSWMTPKLTWRLRTIPIRRYQTGKREHCWLLG